MNGERDLSSLIFIESEALERMSGPEALEALAEKLITYEASHKSMLAWAEETKQPAEGVTREKGFLQGLEFVSILIGVNLRAGGRDA